MDDLVVLFKSPFRKSQRFPWDNLGMIVCTNCDCSITRNRYYICDILTLWDSQKHERTSKMLSTMLPFNVYRRVENKQQLSYIDLQTAVSEKRGSMLLKAYRIISAF